MKNKVNRVNRALKVLFIVSIICSQSLGLGLYAATITLELKNLKAGKDASKSTIVCSIVATSKESFEDMDTEAGPVGMVKYGEIAYSGCVRVFGETMSVRIGDVPADNYAVRSFIDENRDGMLEMNVLGIPKEPVAISGKQRLGPPKFSRAAEHVSADEDKVFTLKF